MSHCEAFFAEAILRIQSHDFQKIASLRNAPKKRLFLPERMALRPCTTRNDNYKITFNEYSKGEPDYALANGPAERKR